MHSIGIGLECIGNQEVYVVRCSMKDNGAVAQRHIYTGSQTNYEWYTYVVQACVTVCVCVCYSEERTVACYML